MNLQVCGHHLEITPALRDYVTGKLERITRHFDNVIDVNVILSVDKLNQKAEVTVHLAGKDVYVEKPLTHDLAEGRAVIDAQNTHKRIVQVGIQGTGITGALRIFEMAAAFGLPVALVNSPGRYAAHVGTVLSNHLMMEVLDPGPDAAMHASAGQNDPFVLAIDGAGQYRWSRSWSTSCMTLAPPRWPKALKPATKRLVARRCIST